MLAKILNTDGYHQAKHMKGLWFHKTKNISFTLVVDDFGVPFIHKEEIKGLVRILEGTYPYK